MDNPRRTLRSADGIAPAGLDLLRANLRGKALVQGEPGYDEARSLWNAMVDRRPGVAIRCMGASDVINVMHFADEHDLTIAVRSGGANVAGTAASEGGVLIDLSPMKTVRVDPEARRAWVGPGASLGDIDKETQAFGLAVPTGINSTTGIAGLTLGGGFGWLTRPFGMTIDNLTSADIVTADGELVQASADENPDLFWAIRGGGGNFGVVTSFEFALHPVGPKVFSGLVVHPFTHAKDLLKGYRRVAAGAPDDLTIWCVLRKAPALPSIPSEWHGRNVVIFAACYVGAVDKAEEAVAPLRALGRPVADTLGPHPFVGWQTTFDPLLAPGARNYWKTHDFAELTDGALDAIVLAAGQLPGPECELLIAHVGGAMSRVPADATAYPHRGAHFIMNVHTRWHDEADDVACIGWTQDLFEDTEPSATGGGYVNFMMADEPERIEKVYGANYARLVEMKQKWDPANRFRLNQNIPPAD